MTFDQFREGDAVFLDANIFVYHFVGVSQQCKLLLRQCRERFLHGTTASFILAETVHRLIVAEAIERKLVTARNPVKQLRERPNVVRQLHKHAESVHKIRAMNIEIVPLTVSAIAASADVRTRYGLLTNDSILVAVIEDRGMQRLATLDQDFERVEWLLVYKPTDV